MRIRTVLTALVVMSVAGSAAWANRAPPRILPPPELPKAEGPQLRVRPTPGAPEAILTIPRKLLPAGEKPKADAGGATPTQTAVAGVALAGAVTLGGVHLLRRSTGRRAAAWLLPVAGASAVAAATTIVWANGAPRPYTLPPLPVAPTSQLPASMPAGGGPITWELRSDGSGVVATGRVPVTIRVVDDGDAVELSIDPAVVAAAGKPPASTFPPGR